MSTLPKDLAAQVVYMPSAEEGPRFFIPEAALSGMSPYVRGLKQAHPKVVVIAGVTVGAQRGGLFGPEDDEALEREIVEKFGIKDPRTARRAPTLEGPVVTNQTFPAEDGGPVERQTPAPDLGYQPQLQRPEGRGRPPKYPFRQMTQVGDHFLAVGASRPKMQATGCNYLTKSGLRGSYEYNYIRVERGVLVVVVQAPGDRSRFEADGTSDGD